MEFTLTGSISQLESEVICINQPSCRSLLKQHIFFHNASEKSPQSFPSSFWWNRVIKWRLAPLDLG